MKLSDFLRAAERNSRQWYRKRRFLQNAPNPYGISEQEAKKAGKLGFTPEEYAVYQLDQNDPRDYLSEYERELLRDGAKHYRILFDNKIVFYQFIRNLAPVNTIYGYRKSGQYVAFEEGWDADALFDRLMESGAVVCKRIGAGGGDGFQLLEYRDSLFWINRSVCDAAAIKKILKQDNCLFEAYCCQSQFENDIWPYAVNTLRLITIMEPGKQANVILALHRFGMDQYKCVDNAHAGGLIARIDMERGVLSGAVCADKTRMTDNNGNLIVYDRHPVTGAAIAGIEIPNWQQIRSKIEQLHTSLAFTSVGFIAWDVALTEKGICIIEGNTSCSMTLMQAFEGMKKKEIGVWMQKNGYCSK